MAAASSSSSPPRPPAASIVAMPFDWQWQEFFNEQDALKALTALGKDACHQLFAFKCDRSGRQMFVLAEPEVVGEVVLGRRTVPGGRGVFPYARHCYEYIVDYNAPVSLFAFGEVDLTLNPNHDFDAAFASFKEIIKSTCEALFAANGIKISQRICFRIEKCVTAEVFSFYVRLPCIFVKNMEEQRAFWHQVLRMHARSKVDISVLNVHARGVDGLVGNAPFFDVRAYNSSSRLCVATTGSARQTDDDTQACFLSEHTKTRADISLKHWLHGLVTPKDRPGYTLSIPEEWYKNMQVVDQGLTLLKTALEGRKDFAEIVRAAIQ